MMPRTVTTKAQDEVIRLAQRELQADERVVACWLEGSFASGTADAWSDVDLHVAVADEQWGGFFAQRLETLARIRPALAFGEADLPWGAHLVFATLAGPVRLDLYIEKVSRLSGAVRGEEPRVLFDKVGAARSLKMSREIEALIRLRLRELLRQFFFGAMWPVRLWGREEWGTLFMNAVSIIYQFLVPAMLIQDHPQHFFRPHYHNERQLRAERQRIIGGLLGEVLTAFRGIEHGRPKHEELLRLHQGLIAAIWRELRAACERYGVAYPDAAEREMREYYRRELGLEFAA